ncbi:MAG: hypothetical protein ABSC94_15355 [Polyangiaceae bacterium]
MDSLGLARVAIATLVAAILTATGPPKTASARSRTLRIDLWADRDDDDANGRADGEQDFLPPAARVDLVPVDTRLWGAKVEVLSGGGHARLVAASGRPLPWSRTLTAADSFEGLTPGRVELLAKSADEELHVTLAVSGIDLRDGEGQLVDMARSQASLERSPPMRSEGPIDGPYDDFDALRAVIVVPDEGPGLDADRDVTIDSVSALGVRIDQLGAVTASPSPCARPYEGVKCWATRPLRFVGDDVDRNHPLVVGRSIKAQVGGAIVFRSGGRKLQMVRVLGPRSSPVGSIGRLRVRLRPFVLRVGAGGAPAIGGTDSGAVEDLHNELASAAAIWGQCGVTFGDLRQLDVKVVDPPPPHLVAVGDVLGLPASGGEIKLRVDNRRIDLVTIPGESPDAVAARLAREVERAGLLAVVSPNARIGPASGGSVDVSVRRRDETLLAVEAAAGGRVSTDQTLTVRIGSVDLSDGLQHFSDADAMAGTLEERTLLKALDDGDPTTIEVVVVPLFAGGGRIGESFIGSDLSSLRNVVLIDRAGIRTRKSSLTVAHELGHVLMDLPGHPDDYALDTPTLLMDSDAADASPFGPRRLPLEHCARVMRQAGPQARVPLLADWPIGPIPNLSR